MHRWLVFVFVFGGLAAVMTTAAQAPLDPTMAPLWHTAARGRGMPAVRGNRAYALSTDHHVVALSLDDGTEQWRRSTGESGWITEGFRVVVAGDAVIAGDWDLYAYHAESGNRLWEFHPSTGYGPGGFLGQAWGDRVFTGSPSGSIYAVAATTGRELWRAPIETNGQTSVFEPVTDGAVVVAGYTIFTAPNTGGVVAVDAATGKERWRFKYPAPADRSLSAYWAGGPVLTKDLAIASSGDGQVWALDLQNGVLRWTLPALTGPIDGIITTTNREVRSLAVEQGRLIVGSLTGYLVAYDIATQREVWRLENGRLGSIGFDDFTSGNGVVYVPYASGFLIAVEVERGAVLWQTRDYKQGLAWPPAVAGDRVVAAGAAGFWAFPAGPRPEPAAAGDGDASAARPGFSAPFDRRLEPQP
jgi:outer membrane protein assembly factor BamB